MQSKAETVNEYIAELPDERREIIQAVREVILANLPAGYEEGMQYGMIGYYVPHCEYPAGYHCDPKQPLPFASLASQKNHISVYLYCVYSDEKQQTWFRKAWEKTGKKLNMGKSCVRFRKLEDVPLKVIGQAIKRVPMATFVKSYEEATLGHRRRATARKKSPRKKTVARKKPAGSKKTTK